MLRRTHQENTHVRARTSNFSSNTRDSLSLSLLYKGLLCCYVKRTIHKILLVAKSWRHRDENLMKLCRQQWSLFTFSVSGVGAFEHLYINDAVVFVCVVVCSLWHGQGSETTLPVVTPPITSTLNGRKNDASSLSFVYAVASIVVCGLLRAVLNRIVVMLIYSTTYYYTTI